jgi:hypothetical protein
MKKLVIALAIIITTVAFAQEFKYPGAKCTDLTLLQEQLAIAPSNDYKVLLTVQISHIQAPAASFEELRTRISQIAETVCGASVTDSAKNHYCKQFAYLQNLWLDDLAVFCLANPSAYDLNIALRGQAQSKPWALSMLVACVSNYDLRAVRVPKALTALVNYHLSGELASDEFKVILEKMDIRYTNKLIKNKEEWAPVVAGIRTLRERFQN